MKAYQHWLNEVRSALQSINMPMDDWQRLWPFDFEGEHRAGTAPADVAAKANRYWWHQLNKSIGQDCQKSADCWLPRGHKGQCQPEVLKRRKLPF